MSATTQGRRVYPNADGDLYLAEGDYGKDKDGVWNVHPPNSGGGFLEADKWTVTEHEDGTISATPSIDTGSWHGCLERGVWREV